MGVKAEPPSGGEGGATILVVEDDPALRMLCRVNLELERYRVLEADTMDRAIQLVESEPIDVVLLDLHVGDRYGLELLPILREQRPEAAVCVLSGTSEADPPQDEGVSAFIRKPFELHELTGTVERLRSQQPVRHP
jgi:DNA-binding response OmpR family regulator